MRTMRKTPWVAGCCGPMLMLRSIVSSWSEYARRSECGSFTATVAPLPTPRQTGSRAAGQKTTLLPVACCLLLPLSRLFLGGCLDFEAGAGWDVAGAAHFRPECFALPLFQRRKRVVFAHRVVVEHIVWKEDGHQVGMALEDD